MISRKDFLERSAVLGLGAALPGPLPRPLATDDAVAEGGRTAPGGGGGLAVPLPERFDPWVEVIPTHLRANLAEVRRLSGGRPVLAVLKNNAYGLALDVAGPVLDAQEGIWGFAVVKADEARSLRAAGVTKPILLMGMFDPDEGPELAELGVQLSAYTPDAAFRLEAVHARTRRPVEVHAYLDTGMSRMGMPYREAAPWMAELAAHPAVRLWGTFTALTEDPDFDPVQLRRLREVVAEVRRSGADPGAVHAASSNGVFHLPEAHLEMVRPGIALYGSYPSRPDEERRMATLRPAVRLRARVVRVAALKAGETIGYGRAWTAERDTWIATLPVGHADGLPRAAVRGGRVLIGDRTYPLAGAVTASHVEVELGPEEPEVRVGDVATLLGPDHPDVDPNRQADAMGVSVYDLLMHLNPDLPRVVV